MEDKSYDALIHECPSVVLAFDERMKEVVNEMSLYWVRSPRHFDNRRRSSLGIGEIFSKKGWIYRSAHQENFKRFPLRSLFLDQAFQNNKKEIGINVTLMNLDDD